MAPKRKKIIKPLDDCVKTLKSLPSFFSLSSKEASEVYADSLAFCYHLSIDQKHISRIRKRPRDNNKTNDIPSYPKPKEIPAMTAVIHNQSLFQAFISCLTAGSECNDGPTMTTVGSSSTLFTPGTRKRNHSIDLSHTISESIPNKSMKLAHGQSPHVGKRTIPPNAKPLMNIRVLAATILYAALEPLDHWPVPLIEAYAEDCFGPRNWVDDPMCHLLFQNLSLVQSESDESLEANEEEKIHRDADALLVADFFLSQKNKHRHQLSGNPLASTINSPKVSPRNGSLSTDVSTGIPMAPSLIRQRSSSFGSYDNSRRSMSPPQVNDISTKSSDLNGGDESDSGDEVEIAITTSLSKPSADDDGSSSSSGEDEEMLMEGRSVDGSEMAVNDASPKQEYSSSTDLPPPGPILTYPVQQKILKYSKVRQRFFGLNLDYAYNAVADKLSDRLEIRSKQNSGLLQCLPSFTTIPRVRSLITSNLEKWLQSPALSGLARNLFTATVSNMKNVDPPLPADLKTLDNILSMRLKANQLNAHVDNVTAVASKIPTTAVVNHIFGHLLRDILTSMESHDKACSDHLSMIHAVHDVLPKQLRGEGLGSSLLELLMKPPIALQHLTKIELTGRIRTLIQTIAKKFGSSLDPYKLLQAMTFYRIGPEGSQSIEEEENRARLMFQCATLLVDPVVTRERLQTGGKSVKPVGPTQEDISILKSTLLKARKLLLRWCCTDYAPLCPASSRQSLKNHRTGGKKNDDIIGAGPPDYGSILDGLNRGNFPHWLDVIRCILFMESPDSPKLLQFLVPGGVSLESDPGSAEEAERISFCWEHGCDLDDEMIWVVLKAAARKQNPIPSEIALTLLEHMFDCCKKGRNAELLLHDPDIMWKLYDLVEYIPSRKAIDVDSNTVNGIGDVRMVKEGEKCTKENLQTSFNGSINRPEVTTPRLAYAGMWWRVTSLALIICGASADVVGRAAWDNHPTLKALIKMVTSDRYRFPTVDCDDAAREEQKKIEQTMRDEEARVSEILFLPQRKPKRKQIIEDINNGSSGARASKRQQEKREKMLEKQREKERAEEIAEAHRRKRMLRAAQKSIVLLDPTKGPRKPPKQSADLIFSVGELFDLSRLFQKCVEPDFVLGTIGSTTRGAIERAYDWLIPIISFLPNTISRLPASASCFLLLRAYGTEGEERSQLQKLSSPLLEHVHDSLVGKFGEADSIRAFDLLLTDIASHNPDRRRCARRVLQNAIGDEMFQENDITFNSSSYTWITNLMHVEHVESILEEATKRIALSASFERGSNLRFLILGLFKLTKYAISRKLPGNWNFPSLLLGLISRRPTVFASALSSFPDLRSLAIQVIADGFRNHTQQQHIDAGSKSLLVTISLCCNPFVKEKVEPWETTLPLAVLESSCVLLSIYSDNEDTKEDVNAIDNLVKMLMRSREIQGDSVSTTECADGLASAKFADTGEKAIPVESWVMLAKSRSDFIAKRAALTAPTVFLPRLLLCSGLPKASLLSMIDRLGRLGEAADDVNKMYNHLLVPSASSEWDIGRLGHRREVARKLLGRISAYSRMYKVKDLGDGKAVSLTFVSWLSTICQTSDKLAKPKPKKGKIDTPTIYADIENAESLLETLPLNIMDSIDTVECSQLDGDASDMTEFLQFQDEGILALPERLDDFNSIEKFLDSAFEEDKPDALDQWLEKNFGFPISSHTQQESQKMDGTQLSFLLLHRYIGLERKVEGLASILVKWVPRISAGGGSPELWKILFAEGQKPSFLWINLVSRCCQAWNHSHVISCRLWLLSEGRMEKLDLIKVVRFLIDASTFQAVHVESFVNIPVALEDSAWARSEDTVGGATAIAFDTLLATNCESELRSRNNIPECLMLLMSIARMGRKQVQFVTGTIMERLQKEKTDSRHLLLLALLRLYAAFPLTMNLGAADIRSNLTDAVKLCSNDWLTWRSPLDDSLQDMLNSALCTSSLPRASQSMIDAAKKHPLLLLRKLDRIVAILEEDATAIDDPAKRENPGVIVGHTLDGSLRAILNGKYVKLDIIHWGYNYTENIWLTFLDVVAAVPNEVLFDCALKMGLTDLLDVYVRLVFVQSQLRSSTNDRNLKVKTKLSEFLGLFKSINTEMWSVWLASRNSGLASLGANRNILMSCGFISHDEAMDSIKPKVEKSSS